MDNSNSTDKTNSGNNVSDAIFNKDQDQDQDQDQDYDPDPDPVSQIVDESKEPVYDMAFKWIVASVSEMKSKAGFLLDQVVGLFARTVKYIRGKMVTKSEGEGEGDGICGVGKKHD